MTHSGARTMLRCHEAVKFVLDDAPSAFNAKHLDDRTLALSKRIDRALPFCSAQHYLTKPDRPYGDFPG